MSIRFDNDDYHNAYDNVTVVEEKSYLIPQEYSFYQERSLLPLYNRSTIS